VRVEAGALEQRDGEFAQFRLNEAVELRPVDLRAVKPSEDARLSSP
jgi:hypothetical protein